MVGSGVAYEADVSAKQPPAEEDARIPRAHEHAGWSSCPRRAAAQGPQAPDAVTARCARASAPQRGVPRCLRGGRQGGGALPGDFRSTKEGRRPAARDHRDAAGGKRGGAEPRPSTRQGACSAPRPRDRCARRGRRGQRPPGMRRRALGRTRGGLSPLRDGRAASAWSAHIVIAALRAYKRWVSPLLPPACRFEPTCSEYMRDAMAAHGLGRGFWLGVRRLARCHPWHPGGYDPVPPRAGGK